MRAACDQTSLFNPVQSYYKLQSMTADGIEGSLSKEEDKMKVEGRMCGIGSMEFQEIA